MARPQKNDFYVHGFFFRLISIIFHFFFLLALFVRNANHRGFSFLPWTQGGIDDDHGEEHYLSKFTFQSVLFTHWLISCKLNIYRHFLIYCLQNIQQRRWSLGSGRSRRRLLSNGKAPQSSPLHGLFLTRKKRALWTAHETESGEREDQQKESLREISICCSGGHWWWSISVQGTRVFHSNC